MIFLKAQIARNISLLAMLSFSIIPFQISAQNKDSAEDNRVYVIVPQMPTFPGDLDSYMGSHLQYPQSAIDKGIQGTVNVTFVISRRGEIRDIAISSGVSPDLDSEAVNVVRAMPPWNPGTKDGKPVNVQYTLPVYFQLNNGNNNKQSEQSQTVYEPPTPRDTMFILRDGLYIDPYVGFGEGGPLSSAATSTTPAINLGLNMKFGVGITYMYPSNIGLSIGLQVQQYNFNYTCSNITGPSAYNLTGTENRTTSNDTTVTAGYNENIKYSFMYAQVPVLCRYISSQENQIGFYAEAGIIVNYLMSSTISGTATQTQYQLYQASNTFWYNYYSTSTNSATVGLASQNPNKLTFAAHLSAGVLIPCTEKMSLILALSPDIGIMNAGDGSKDAVSFGSSKYYIYGQGNYGSFNCCTFDVKLLIKMFGSSQSVRRY